MLESVNLELLTRALETSGSIAPPLGPLRQVGSGFYSFVFESPNGWIFRVARTPNAAARHAFESRVLERLASYLPVAIPHPGIALPAVAVAPFGVQAYRSLPGRLMERADFANGCGAGIARDLGAALAALHGVSRNALAPEDIPRGEPDHHRKVRDETIGHLERRLSREEFVQLRGWWEDFLSGETVNTSIRTLTHGDPWWENLTVADGHLAGILDWEFLAWWDPANDVGVTLQMGEQFFSEVLEAYRVKSRRADPTLEQRARQIAAFREFYGVQLSIERNDEAEWADSLAKLRAGPVLGMRR